MYIIPILIVAVTVAAVGFVFFMLTVRAKKNGRSGGKKKKALSKEAQLQDAMKTLQKNPRDPLSLFIVAENHFENGDWDKAFPNYELIADMTDKKAEIDDTAVNLHAAICASNMQMMDIAYKYIVVAHSLAPSNHEISYHLGNIEFQRKNYEKTVQFLQQSITLNPDYAPSLRLLGHAYFKLKRSKEALTYIRRAIDLTPDDKESLFTLAECYEESGQVDQAQRIYTHLRSDPVWGADACLHSGLNKVELHKDAEAILDFQIGLKHQNLKPDVNIELRYQIGTAFLRIQKINESLQYLSQVQTLSSNYKDTQNLIKKYKELNASKNLQTYIMSPGAEFVALCRKITLSYFPKAKVKITKTQVAGNEWVDVVAEIDTPKWSDIVMFRFIRSQGIIGELVVRDFHSRLKDVKAGKGICVGVGQYSDEAKRFTEARLIDLIDKDRFTPILNAIDSPRDEA
jgi:tetratricopeptide (TPR) repeat protein